VPARAVNVARNIRDRAGMLTEPRLAFDPASLRSAANLSLSSLFADAAIAAAWHDDHAAISALFGDHEWPGSDNPGDRRALYHIVGSLRPRNLLEIGTYIGGSTLYLARALKRIGATGGLTTVDIQDVNDPAAAPWKDVGLSMPPIELARRLDCADVITFQTGASLDFMKTTDRRFDLVYLDGDMAARSVYRNVAGALGVLQPDGVILLHAYYPNAAPLFLDNVVLGGPFYAMARITRENPGIRVLPLGNLPWPTKQGSHATTLALVLRQA
jgi:predicted O-methyltransferase YrrM